MAFLRWLSQMRELPWYILTRCAILTAVMLLGALLAMVWAMAGGGLPDLLRRYSGDLLTWAPVVFFAGLFGAAFLEDVLDRQGE